MYMYMCRWRPLRSSFTVLIVAKMYVYFRAPHIHTLYTEAVNMFMSYTYIMVYSYEIFLFTSQSMKVLGEIPASRMKGAVIVGDKNNFHCFGINMRYDTTVVLGCKKQTVS